MFEQGSGIMRKEGKVTGEYRWAVCPTSVVMI